MHANSAPAVDRLKRALVGATLVLAAGCGDDNGPRRLNGSVSFSHSGAVSGLFEATGSFVITDPDAAEFAVAVRDVPSDAVGIFATVPKGGNTTDNIIMLFPQQTTGSVTIANGSAIDVVFGQPESGTATWSCVITSGTITVTDISDDRVRGSFSGTGTCSDSGGGTSALTITNGSFDVPFIDFGGLP